MKITVDGVDLFELTPMQSKVIMNQISQDIFDEDMKRRLQWVLMHKYENCFQELKAEWDPKLKAQGYKMIPTEEAEYAAMVFAQPSYQDRSAREKASQ